MEHEPADNICPVCGDPLAEGTLTCTHCGTLVTSATTEADNTDEDLFTATSQIFGDTSATHGFQQAEPYSSAFADMYFGPDNEEFLAAFQLRDVVPIPKQQSTDTQAPAPQDTTSVDTIVKPGATNSPNASTQPEQAALQGHANADDNPTQLTADTLKPTKELPGGTKKRKRARLVIGSTLGIAAIAAAGATAVLAAPQSAPEPEPEPEPIAYTITYIDENSGAELYTREGIDLPGTRIAAQAKKFSGYKLSKSNPPDLTMGLKEGSDNTLTVLYTKVVSYTVKYIDKKTKKSIKTSKKVKGKLEGSSVTAKAPSISGYTKPSKTKVKLKLEATSSHNVVTFKYTKKETQPAATSSSYSYTPSYSYSSSSGSSASNSGSSGSSKKSSSSSKPKDSGEALSDIGW